MLTLISLPKKEKAQPKPATNTKNAKGANAGRGRGGKRGGRGGRGGGSLPKKTVEELDAEMVDYFGPANGEAADGDAMQTNGGAVQAPGGGDTGMEDEML